MNKIEWCDKTVNPIVGCRKISTGCKHCYAALMAKRLAAMPKPSLVYGDVGKWDGRQAFTFLPMTRLANCRTSWRIFVGSMADMFLGLERESYDWVRLLFQFMTVVPQHRYMMLTKRPHNLSSYFGFAGEYGFERSSFPREMPILSLFGVKLDDDWRMPFASARPLWIGTSVENAEVALERVSHLCATGVRHHRFLSVEPLLGPIPDLFASDKRGEIEWVICGGENGRKARAMKLTWAEDIAMQCRNRGVPFFFKGCGAASVEREEPWMVKEFPLALQRGSDGKFLAE